MKGIFANTVLMVRPAAFGFNEQTAADNGFQQRSSLSPSALQAAALGEFDAMVQQLTQHGIRVIVAEDTPQPRKTDAIFPNNWISMMPDGRIDLFPMMAPSRRPEKRESIVKLIRQHFEVTDLADWSEFEAEGFFLEGTGSMVMDHANRIIYAGLSQRTHPSLLEKFARLHQYRVLAFDTKDKNGLPVYHTNVMLCIGHGFAVVSDETITDEMDWIAVSQLLRSTGHTIITLQLDQVAAFAGNMLQLQNDKGEPVLVLSQTAYHSFTEQQVKTLESFTKLLIVDVSTIENEGGGGARCMMAEVFLKPLN